MWNIGNMRCLYDLLEDEGSNKSAKETYKSPRNMHTWIWKVSLILLDEWHAQETYSMKYSPRTVCNWEQGIKNKGGKEIKKG